MRTLTIVLFIVLFGCSFTPELKKPEIDIPSDLKPSALSLKPEAYSLQPYWWRQFNDPVLDNLIEEALRNNDDLMIAVSRIEQAGAILGISSSQLYPFLTAGGSFTRARVSEEIHNGGGTNNTFTLSAMVSYEIDLWGKLRNKKGADLSRFLATKAARDSLEIGIISAVASTYFNLISTDRQIKTAQEIMQRQKDIYEFRQKQFRHGLIDELTLEQSKAEYESTGILVETLKSQKDTIKSSLSILLGKSPKDLFESEIEISSDLPEKLFLPLMLPSELLLKRPDIIQAEENLRAANFEIAVARASYFPSIILTGSAGFQSNELSNLIQSSASFWNIGAIAAGTVLDFGRTKNTIMLKEAQKKEALLQYVRTVRTAFKEVYDAIINLEQSIKRLEAQKAQLDSLEKVIALAEKKYERGLTEYLTVLDSQRGYLNARLNLIRLQTEVINNHVFLYKALGWGIRNQEVR
ncbi:MAG: efflux transporter outer membrane subunit [Thermodesulfovibrionales bacterium]